MDEITLKKEFKRLCRAEKRSCLRFKLLGTLTALIGLILAIVLLCLVLSDAIGLDGVVPLAAAAIAVAAVGAVIDIYGDMRFKKEFDAYKLEKTQGK